MTTRWVLGTLLVLSTPARLRAEAPPLRLQAIARAEPGACTSFPELDARVFAEVKQLTGRVLQKAAPIAVNPTLTPVAPFQLFGGYVEPVDNGAWRARLWLKDAGVLRVAVRDAYYRSLERLTAELPADAAALVLLPDWSRTGSAAPQYCRATAPSPYPEDACDPFLPPPGCAVAFDCTQNDQRPRCPAGPTCGVAGLPACPPAAPSCRVRDWRFGTGIAALVVGGAAVTVGGVFQLVARDGSATAPAFAGNSAAIPSYIVGGAMLGVGAGLLGYWGTHARTAPCRVGK